MTTLELKAQFSSVAARYAGAGPDLRVHEHGAEARDAAEPYLSSISYGWAGTVYDRNGGRWRAEILRMRDRGRTAVKPLMFSVSRSGRPRASGRHDASGSVTEYRFWCFEYS